MRILATTAAASTSTPAADGWAILASVSAAATALATILALAYAGGQYRRARGAQWEARSAAGEAEKARARAERLHEKSLQPYVVVTPVPERTHGRDLVVQVQNYGPTAAHDVRVNFPNQRVAVSVHRNDDGGVRIQQDLILATTVLAPGQTITEAAMLLEDHRAEILSTDICVTYRDSQGAQLENRYSVTFTAATRFSPDPLTSSVQDIAHTLQRVTSLNDQRSVTIETRDAQQRRIWGAGQGAAPPAGSSPHGDDPEE